MRFLILVNALDRSMQALLPFDVVFLTREIPYILTIDLLCNYCLDFWATLVVLQLEVAAIFIINNLTNNEDIARSTSFGTLVAVTMLLVFLAVAILVGSFFVKGYKLNLLNNIDESLSFIRSEGVVIVTNDRSKVIYMNKSAQI